MRVVRCKNGHYFDQDKFEKCPYCKEITPGSAGISPISVDDDVTMSFEDEKTSAYEDMPTVKFEEPAEKAEEKKEDDDEEKTVSFWDLKKEEEEKKTPPAQANGNTYGTDWNSVSMPADGGAWGLTQPPELPQESIEPVAGWLVCVEGPCRGRDYRLVEGRNFIGRSKEMDICIPEDAQLSRECHCSVIYDPRSYRFVALPGSTAASRLNDEDINGPVDLKDGDILCCGSTKFCFIGYCKEGREWE